MKRILDGQKQNMVGPRIKQLRLEKGMTQKTLAERLETLAVYVCRGSISRIEEQKRTITDIELAGIAEVTAGGHIRILQKRRMSGHPR